MPAIWPAIALPDIGMTEGYEDSTIETPFEAGYEQTRPRYTRNRRGPWNLSWETIPLTPADYAALRAFLQTVRGGLSITWTCPFTETEHIVRVTQVGQFRLVSIDGVPGWAGSITLREV